MAMPLQFYSVRFMGLNWSLDRILLMVLLFLMFFRYSSQFREKLYIYFILIWIIIILLNFLIFYSENGSEMIMKMPSYFLCSLTLLLSVTAMKQDYRIIFKKAIIGQAFIIVVFGLYSIYYLWILNETTFRPPFLSDSQYLTWSESSAHMIGIMSRKRLTFPFATSPFLSFVAGFILIYGLFQLYIRSNNIIWYFLTPCLFIILLGSFSRSGFLAFLISISIAYLFQKNNKNLYNTKPIRFLLVIIFLALPLYIGVISELLNLSMLPRIFEFDISSNDSSFAGHLNIRVKIIKEIFSSNFVNLFFGFGIGGTQKYLYVSSGHMSFATILYDMGLLGLISFTILWIYPVIKLILNNSVYKKPKKIFIIATGLYLIFCHMFYNATTFLPLWFYLGWIVNYFNEPIKLKIA